MAGYSTKIESKTLENEAFRRVLFTAPHSQLVVMTLRPGEEIGTEVHSDGDQFFSIEGGRAEAILDGETYTLGDGDVIVIPAGTEHNVINMSVTEPLRLFTIYSPPQHPDGTIHQTKADADAAELAHHS